MLPRASSGRCFRCAAGGWRDAEPAGVDAETCLHRGMVTVSMPKAPRTDPHWKRNLRALEWARTTASQRHRQPCCADLGHLNHLRRTSRSPDRAEHQKAQPKRSDVAAEVANLKPTQYKSTTYVTWCRTRVSGLVPPCAGHCRWRCGANVDSMLRGRWHKRERCVSATTSRHGFRRSCLQLAQRPCRTVPTPPRLQFALTKGLNAARPALLSH